MVVSPRGIARSSGEPAVGALTIGRALYIITRLRRLGVFTAELRDCVNGYKKPTRAIMFRPLFDEPEQLLDITEVLWWFCYRPRDRRQTSYAPDEIPMTAGDEGLLYYAAQDYPGHDPALRERLLRAAGLPVN